MDATLICCSAEDVGGLPRPSWSEAEAAVRILIRWIGEDPAREGLRETPKRVLRAYEEWFAGYENEPKQLLERCFEEVAGYDETVLLRDVPFRSHYEHHIAPITGRVHLAYLPDKRVVGISKLVRLVQVFSNRLQIQERLTAQIADTINEVLKPRGTGVVIQATHACMTGRGVHACGTNLITSRLLGVFRDNVQARQELFAATNLRQNGHAFCC